MKNSVYLSYGTFISPLGIGVQTNFEQIKKGESGIKKYTNSGFKQEDWFLSKIEQLSDENRFNQLLELAIDDLLASIEPAILETKNKRIILSSTKGNIDDLPGDVFASARTIITNKLGSESEPIIISNACISGVIAINAAADYIRYSDCDHVIVIGIDVVTDFVLYGFQSLFALSDEPVQPFDKARKGISLGEACGIIIASKEKPNGFCVEYLAGASSNDANHISGPSRTGEGLFRVVNQTIAKSAIDASAIQFISAHGTGTVYNDEMESIAFTRCQLNKVPINSMKGYFGHTLGAAGVIETLVCMMSLETDLLIESKGFQKQGTSEKINLIESTVSSEINLVLKTASGFGGGNAALLLKKVK